MSGASVLGGATTSFCVGADHPALPGHFPGAPVVPGALLLAEGLRRLEVLTDPPFRCRRIDSAKFLRPVGAGETVTATLQLTTVGQASVKFLIGEKLVALADIVTDACAERDARG